MNQTPTTKRHMPHIHTREGVTDLFHATIWQRILTACVIVTSMCASLPAMADATQGMPRIASGGELALSQPKSLHLPDGSETTVTPLWETDLYNRDAYQDNASIAVSGDVVYLCVTYCENFETGESRDNLIIRRFDTNTGAELQPLIIALTDDLLKPGGGNPSQDFVIGNDMQGNLLLASCYRHEGNYEARITLIPMDEEGNLILRRKVEIDYDSNDVDRYMTVCRIDIDAIEGDIASDDYKAYLTLVWTENPHFAKQPVVVVDGSKAAVEYIYAMDPYGTYYDASFRPSPTCRPELHKVAGSDMFVVSDKMCVGNYATPTLFTSRNGWLNFAEAMDAKTHSAVPVTADGTCRGFYTFRHGDALLAAYAAECSEAGGTRFYLSTWADPTSFETLGAEHLTIPDNAFKYPQKPYKNTYRQVATSRAVDSDLRSGWTRPENDDTPVTDLFVCAPGTGIAAYRLSPGDHPTGVGEMVHELSDDVSLSLEGTMLVARNVTPASVPPSLTITDLSGRVVYSSRWGGDPLSLERFGRGVYIASYASARLKIAIQ